MAALYLLWLVATSLIALCGFGGVAVVALRIAANTREKLRIRVHAILLEKVLRSDRRTDGPEWVSRELARHPSVAAELVAELGEVIVGAERERVLRMAERAGIERWLCWRSRFGTSMQRRAATETLRLFDSPASLLALQRRLHDRNQNIRMAAALSLAGRGGAPTVLSLLDRLRVAVGRRSKLLLPLFEKLAETQGMELVALALNPQRDSWLRAMAITAVGGKDHSAFASFIGLAADPHADIRAAVLCCCAAQGGAAAAETVRAGLRDPAVEVRIAACHVTRRCGLSETIPTLQLLLDDESWPVRLQAGRALLDFGEPGYAALKEIANFSRGRCRDMAELLLLERTAA